MENLCPHIFLHLSVWLWPSDEPFVWRVWLVSLEWAAGRCLPLQKLPKSHSVLCFCHFCSNVFVNILRICRMNSNKLTLSKEKPHIIWVRKCLDLYYLCFISYYSWLCFYLCNAHWIASVCEMGCINKLALSCHIKCHIKLKQLTCEVCYSKIKQFALKCPITDLLLFPLICIAHSIYHTQ